MTRTPAVGGTDVRRLFDPVAILRRAQLRQSLRSRGHLTPPAGADALTAAVWPAAVLAGRAARHSKGMRSPWQAAFLTRTRPPTPRNSISGAIRWTGAHAMVGDVPAWVATRRRYAPPTGERSRWTGHHAADCPCRACSARSI